LRILELRHTGRVRKNRPCILRPSALAGRREANIRSSLLIQHQAGAPGDWRRGNGCYNNQANRYDRVRGETGPVLGRQHFVSSPL